MTHKDVRTIEDALALVDEKARGRTRWPDQPPYIDEMLAGEVRRLRAILDSGELNDIYDVPSLSTTWIIRLPENSNHWTEFRS